MSQSRNCSKRSGTQKTRSSWIHASETGDNYFIAPIKHEKESRRLETRRAPPARERAASVEQSDVHCMFVMKVKMNGDPKKTDPPIKWTGVCPRPSLTGETPPRCTPTTFSNIFESNVPSCFPLPKGDQKNNKKAKEALAIHIVKEDIPALLERFWGTLQLTPLSTKSVTLELFYDDGNPLNLVYKSQSRNDQTIYFHSCTVLNDTDITDLKAPITNDSNQTIGEHLYEILAEDKSGSVSGTMTYISDGGSKRTIKTGKADISLRWTSNVNIVQPKRRRG